MARAEKRPAAHAPQVTPNARENAPTAATWIHVSELRPNPKNPRLHGQEVLLLARTIVRTTWGAPILVQARTMRVIGGHGRLEAAKEILAGIEVDGFLRGGAGYQFRRDAPPECLPVCVLDVSDAEADAMTLADNAKRLQGKDDPSLLVAMATASFERNAPTMIDMGLGADDLDALIKQAGDAVLAGAPTGDGNTERPDVIGDDARERIEVEEDEAPVDRAEELRAKWGTAAGQLWEIPSATVAGGVHRILCGDSTKPEDVARVMAGEEPRVLVTDPPYGIRYRSGIKTSMDGRPRSRTASFGSDEFDPTFLATWAHVAPTIEAVYLWTRWDVMEMWRQAMAEVKWSPRQRLVWDKCHFTMGNLAIYGSQTEDCLFWCSDTHQLLWEKREGNIWRFAAGRCHEGGVVDHPTQKPLGLYRNAIERSVPAGAVVVDTFHGSGTCAVAAEQTGRLCRAVEIAPQYVAVALERLATLGLTPRLVS